MPPTYRYFSIEKDLIGGLDETFLAKLDQARHLAGIPFVITSGFRTPEKNQSIIGSVPDSAHLKGMAVDIRVANTHEVFLIVAAANDVGLTRCGVYVDRNNVPTHVHIDGDPDKPSQVLWVKQEGQPNSTIATA